MDTVLKFPLEKVSRTGKSAGEESMKAEILFFPGVRYSSLPGDIQDAVGKLEKKGRG